MTYYFYDLETSGINPRAQRIMQFAGQRTDENLEPLGQPQNWLVRLTDEILPDPEAVLLTGITPQKTLEEGYSEAEFLKLFEQEVCQPDTIITGFNNIRFDDEFIRSTLWRNFYDPYKWQWQDGSSRWDLLDVVRMVRALRPDGVEWPLDKEGVATNRLELLTKANGLDHDSAHDALSDVMATIAVAKLLKNAQPKIYDYLLKMRSKTAVQKLVNLENPQPFVYTSGRYSGQWHKTTVALPIAEAEHGAVLVYDLRQDPSHLAALSDEELAEAVFNRQEDTEIVAIKTLKPNTCPAIAPLGVMDDDCWQRIGLSQKTIELNLKKLAQHSDLTGRIAKLHTARQKSWKGNFAGETDCDMQLYDGFVPEADQTQSDLVRAAEPKDLPKLKPDFSDQRLRNLWPRYLARNYKNVLSADEREAWEKYRADRLANGLRGQLSLENYAARLGELAQVRTSDNDQYILTELQLWAESIAPILD